jgi:hypothetical protein
MVWMPPIGRLGVAAAASSMAQRMETGAANAGVAVNFPVVTAANDGGPEFTLLPRARVLLVADRPRGICVRLRRGIAQALRPLGLDASLLGVRQERLFEKSGDERADNECEDNRDGSLKARLFALNKCLAHSDSPVTCIGELHACALGGMNASADARTPCFAFDGPPRSVVR